MVVWIDTLLIDKKHHDNKVKKTGTEQFIPKIKEGFIKTMKEKYNVKKEESEQIVESFITVIEDASSYLFSLNHSLPYSYIGYICGYLRYYYPLEFITTTLNINKDDADKTNKTIEYGFLLTASVSCPPSSYPMYPGAAPISLETE